MIDKYVKYVKSSLSDDLRRKKYQGNPNKYVGHCYVATEALWHLLGGKVSSYRPMVMRINDDTHWFLRNNHGDIIDLTAGQFSTQPEYARARGCGFLTKKPSWRAAQVIRSVYGQLAKPFELDR